MLHSARPSQGTERLSENRSQKPLILASVSTEDSDRLIEDFLKTIDTPRSLTVWLLYKSGQHADLVQLSIDPLHYNNPDSFRRDYAATKFLSKTIGLKTGIDLKQVAIDAALKAEAHCQATNEKLRRLRDLRDVNPSLNAKLFRAQQIVADILGPLPKSFEDVGWSKGRTTSSSGDELAGIYKYTSRPDVTWSARRHALSMLRDSPLWGASVLNADGPVSVLSRGLEHVEGNTMITVPKSAKTDRVICYEPHMNIRLQLAVGSYIRRRLFKRGINLNDQSVNRIRALRASRDSSLATIDLSMASDTVSTELVRDLVPVDWYNVLDDLRSKYTLWPDKVLRKNEKFSSMGNGFTFELESLIFYALASVVSQNVSVFGDDVIMPTQSYEEVRNLFVDCGFLLNEKKSFATSYFRESCGMDAFGGVVCTPVYLRVLPKTREDVVKLHNQVRRWCAEDACPQLAFERILDKWRRIHACPYGPEGYGDGHYHVDFDRLNPSRADGGVDGWWYKTYARVSRVSRLHGDRLEGSFPSRFGYAALCVATGPKRSLSVFDSAVDRRQWKYKLRRALASFTWPSIVWV